MLTQEEKLSKFMIAINEYAKEQHDKIMRDLESQNTAELEKAEKEFREDSYKTIQKKTGEIRSMISRELASKELEGKKALLARRTAIENSVFEKAAEKLEEFTKTDAYKTYLRKAAAEARKAFAKCGEDSLASTIIYIRNRDKKCSPLIKTAFGSECTVKVDQNIVLGGLRAENAEIGRVVNVTLDAALEEQHEWFAENSGLTIS
jgi:V/A-type H+-transporting ATPase subunit E